MKVIAVCGKKRSGKDTIAKYISENYNYIPYSFAGPMKIVAEILFGWTQEEIEKNKEVIDPLFGISPRQFLIDFGTNYMQYDLGSRYPLFKEINNRQFWVKSTVNKIKKEGKNAIISDMRFQHEYDYLKENISDVLFIKVNRSVERNYERFDLTETDIDSIPSDIIINNNTDLYDLFKKVDSIME